MQGAEISKQDQDTAQEEDLVKHVQRQNKINFVYILVLFILVIVVAIVLILTNIYFKGLHQHEKVLHFFLLFSIAGFPGLIIGIISLRLGRRERQIKISKGQITEKSKLLAITGLIIVLLSLAGILRLLGFFLFLMSMMGM
jgi:hypothetical protein